MDDNKTLNNETVTPTVNNPELTEAQTLNELKNQITELQAQNKNLQEAKTKYYDAVLNGNSAAVEQPEHRSIGDIRADMINGFEHNITNLDYCKLAVELDDAVRSDAAKHNKVDSVFLPHGKDIQPTVDEYNSANKMNEVLRQCIDQSNNDPDQFNMLLQSHMSKR